MTDFGIRYPDSLPAGWKAYSGPTALTPQEQEDVRGLPDIGDFTEDLLWLMIEAFGWRAGDRCGWDVDELDTPYLEAVAAWVHQRFDFLPTEFLEIGLLFRGLEISDDLYAFCDQIDKTVCDYRI